MDPITLPREDGFRMRGVHVTRMEIFAGLREAPRRTPVFLHLLLMVVASNTCDLRTAFITCIEA